MLGSQCFDVDRTCLIRFEAHATALLDRVSSWQTSKLLGVAADLRRGRLLRRLPTAASTTSAGDGPPESPAREVGGIVH